MSIKDFFNQRIRYAPKVFDYYKLDTTIEFKILLPFLYFTNIICLFSLLIFIQKMKIIYLLPLLFKITGDYWICSNFFTKIKETFNIKFFLILSIVHPFYISSLGVISFFINYPWKSND